MRFHALVFFFLLLVSPAMAAEPQMVPGTGWSFAPPAGFVEKRQPVLLFIHPSKAYIVVTEQPAKPIDLSEFGAIGSTVTKGNSTVRIDAIRETTANGRRAAVVSMRIVNRNLDAITVVVEGERSNVQFVAGIPEGAKDAVDPAALEAAMLTTREVTLTTEQKADALAFRLDELAGFRIADILVGTMLLVTDGPSSDFKKDLGQIYSLIYVNSIGSGGVDFERDKASLVARLGMDSTMDVQEPEIIDTIRGEVLEVRFKTRGTAVSTGGIMWFRVDGDTMIYMRSQHPLDKQEAYDVLAKIRDGVTVK